MFRPPKKCFLTENSYPRLGESLVVLADAVVGAKVQGGVQGDVQTHVGLGKEQQE